jgi:hypothetical protein
MKNNPVVNSIQGHIVDVNVDLYGFERKVSENFLRDETTNMDGTIIMIMIPQNPPVNPTTK